MKHLIRIMYFNALILLLSCNFVPCEKVTDKDVVGYYVSCNPVNNKKQYIKILDNYTFIMLYCNGDSLITEKGTWDRYDGCLVCLNGIRYFNTGFEKDAKDIHYAIFTWVRGKLDLGEDSWSFQKVWRKPKLACER